MTPPIITIARLTIWEAARRKLLIALVVLTLIVIAATGWGYTKLWDANNGQRVSEVEVRLLASQILIVVTFMFAGVLALSSVFVAAPTISADVESGLLLSMLARPVRRLDLVLGKWLGLGVLVMLYAAGSGLLEMLALWWATGYVPPHPTMLVAYVGAEGMTLLTLALALSTRMAGMTGGIIALVGYFLSWIGGILAGVGAALNNSGLSAAGTVVKLLVPTDGLWRGAVYAMEPATVLATARSLGPAASANPFMVVDGPPPAFLLWAVFWVVAVLALTWWSFRSREL